ncbi:MAG: 7-cyano-7-deazaguanine reductase [Candidatus Cloacimonadota bacterium]|nr:7-cyano-7-deazaguanine reductase [Candidatus Cloacimonadota bacterium]
MNEYLITKPDSTLLKPIPRKIGRQNIGWDTKNILFSGIDIWNCYEFSFLEKSGKPFVGILRIKYPSESEFLIESKSLKLYLNSFNMAVFENLKEAIIKIKNDLKSALNSANIKLIITTYEDLNQKFDLAKKFKCIDELKPKNPFQYEVNTDLLQMEQVEKKEHFLMSNLLKSNCPITDQPDWGAVYIYYLANKKKITEESLLQYIVSYRNHQEFHEVCCERILFHLINKIQPEKIMVLCKYNRRGGIDINPLRVYPKEKEFVKNLPTELKEILYLREFRQ